MTTKSAALYSLFSSFGIPAYTVNTVPSDAEFPYLTYESVLGAWDTGLQPITVNLWYYGDSEKAPNDKAQEISEYISTGRIVACDGGGILITRGTPFCQAMTDSDDKIKRRYININLEFITNN